MLKTAAGGLVSAQGCVGARKIWWRFGSPGEFGFLGPFLVLQNSFFSAMAVPRVPEVCAYGIVGPSAELDEGIFGISTWKVAK